jgi:hypothetical protein
MIIRDDKIDGTRHWRALGENLDDVQRWLRDTPNKWRITASRDSGFGREWALGVSYDQALELARTGWSEGAKDLSDRLAAHMPPRDKEDSWRYDVAGELPDIGRYLAGDPVHMRRHGHPKGHQPIVSIAVNIRLQSNVKASAMANYGAALVAVIDQIEHHGKRVELMVTFATRQTGSRVSAGWMVKRAEDALDLAAVAFSVAHPAASRRIGFAMYEHSDVPATRGYGGTLTLGENDLIDPLPGTYCLSGLNDTLGRCHTLDDAITFVRDQVNAAAGEELVTIEA